MNSSYSLMIFIKNPILGAVKTRLATTVGEEKALLVYKKLLGITNSVTINLKVDKVIYYDKNITTQDIWNPAHYRKKIQKGQDLGERMKNAFKEEFANGYKKIVIIGSDCYDINAQIIKDAFDMLSQKDLVIGPAKDGGYYLLGMKKLHEFIFDGMPWSQSYLLNLTLQNITRFGLSYSLLPQLNDIDTLEDLKNSNLRWY